MAQEPYVVELSPSLNPWDAARCLAFLPRLIFFDSAGGPAHLARYSYLAAEPFQWVECRGTDGPNPFDSLRRELQQWRLDSVAGLPPFQAGAAGLFGYDLCHWIERLPRPRYAEFQLPDLAIGVYDWVIAWDHQQNRCWLISTGFPEQGEARRVSRARSRAMQVESILSKPGLPSDQPDPVLVQPLPGYPLPEMPGVFSNFPRAAFLSAVARVIEYIHAGDCFQVNLAQRLLTPQQVDSIVLYDRLRSVNPSPFAAFFDIGEVQILSASPERFLQVSRSGDVETRPIKGTRPRGRDAERDAAEIAHLLHSAKDRAENVMIVDLLRNDLGRVCEYGSVRVESLCRLESYPTVHHLVSEVRGQLRSGLTALDLLRAAFPGGSVTGAPKVRAMEIIAELEPHARGPYCGSLGWIGFDGAMDTNILIRTFTAAGGWLQFPVGGGIVADSDPVREYDETLHKAAGLLRALEAT